MAELLVALLAGLGFGVGVLLVALGSWGVVRSEHEAPVRVVPRVDRWRLRSALAVAGAVVAVVATGWPVAVVLAAVGGFVAPTLIGAKRRRQAEIDKIEAIAAWAEQLRDTIGAAAGLQEAIAVTARVAPRPIRPAVQELAAGMRRNRLADQLRTMARRLDDPTADQIVVALILASEKRGQHLAHLLSDVAAAGRDDVTMRIRTETSRAQIYNDAKVVTGIVAGMFAFMLAFNRSYLDAFDRLGGQLVLAVVGCLWAVALYGIAQLSVVRRPPRLLTASDHSPASSSRSGGGR
ncbi:MAG: type II secretion system F family protein [Actinomycetota bacterium]